MLTNSLLLSTLVPPFTTYKEKRKWKPKFWRKPASENSFSSDDEQSTGPIKYGETCSLRPELLTCGALCLNMCLIFWFIY